MKLQKFSGKPKNKFPLVIRRVQGHSMVHILPPRTLVIGWAWSRDFRTGDVVIFQHDGKEKIKRIKEVLGDGSLYVVGEHPETSTDSRQFGAVDPQSVIARIIWPSVSVD
jgi:signal peptidase I